MKKYTDIFAEDLEIPGIVNQKMEDAFAIIKMEENMSMENISNFNEKKSRKVKLFKHPTVAAACICIVMIGSITAYAACNHFWSRGMKGSLQSTDEQQQTLVEEGIATVFHETDDYTDMAVTDGGITVTPETMVVNEKMVYLSLSVDGYNLKDGEEPDFEFVDVYLGDDPKAEDGWLDMGASFYDGIVSAADGTSMYEDGTPIKTDENGRLISHYTDENGKMEYVIVAMVSDAKESLLGETLHVNLTNFGTVDKAAFAGDIEGKWNYTFNLSDVSSMKAVQVGKEVENTVFVMDSIEISPVSIKLNYDVNGEVNMYEDINRVPEFCGVVLKDGTRLPYLSDGGMSGYTDDTLSKAYDIKAFDRVIEPEQVSAILLRTESEEELFEVKLDR